MRLEQTLKGGYKGLFGEVVTHDCYGLRSLNFVPDIIFDIGANIGVFTRFARELFPNAPVIAVEPHPDNCAVFREHTSDAGVTLIEAAIGRGPVFRATTAANGSGEVYMAPGLGYPRRKMIAPGTNLVPVDTAFYSLDQILAPFWETGKKHLVKIDCEGAENQIFDHPESMDFLKSAQYFALELHRYAIDGAEQEAVNRRTLDALGEFTETHTIVENTPVHFKALKR